MTDHTDFDAEDLVNAVLGVEPTASQPAVTAPVPEAPAKQPASRGDNNLGWLLLVALFLALSVAVGLALTQTSEAQPRCGGLYSDCCDDWDDDWGSCPTVPDDPRRCGGLYSDCCDDWDDNWGPCPESRNRYDDDREGGLFD